MGLDTYLYGRKYLRPDHKDPKKTRTEDGYEVSEVILGLGYWRKFWPLNTYICETFGINDDEVDGSLLTREDVVLVIEALKMGRIEDDVDDAKFHAERVAEAIETLTKAVAWLDAGRRSETDYREIRFEYSC